MDTLFQAFGIGLEEALNPYALTNLLLFMSLVGKYGRDVKRVFVFGFVFVVCSISTKSFISAGDWDVLLGIPITDYFLKHVYLFLGLYLIFVSVLYFRGWQNKKLQNQTFLKQWPVFDGSQEVKRKAMFRIAIAAIFWSSIVTLLGSIWPQTYYLFNLFYQFFEQHHFLLAYVPFIVYSIAFFVPMIVVWLLILWMVKKFQKTFFTERSFSMLMIVLSALYLAVGLGGVYLYFAI